MEIFIGDIPFPIVTCSDMTYTASKAGRALGAAKPDFDDKKWREVSVPHDWVIENDHDKNQNLAQGYRERGIGIIGSLLNFLLQLE